jgi:hypothetical protein
LNNSSNQSEPVSNNTYLFPTNNTYPFPEGPVLADDVSVNLTPTEQDLETIRNFADPSTRKYGDKEHPPKETLQHYGFLTNDLAEEPLKPDTEITRRGTIEGEGRVPIGFPGQYKSSEKTDQQVGDSKQSTIKAGVGFVQRTGTPMFGTSIQKDMFTTYWENSAKFLQLQYILANIEDVLATKYKMIPNNNPIQLYPNGKIRLSRMGTFPNIDKAYQAVVKAVQNVPTPPGKKS